MEGARSVSQVAYPGLQAMWNKWRVPGGAWAGIW